MNKKIILLILLLTIPLFLISLSGGDAMWFFKNTVSLSFNQSGEAFINPLMGFAPECTDKDNNNSLAYFDLTFREFEPEEGLFAFDKIEKDKRISDLKKAGKHIVFRFVCDKPRDFEHMDIPDWLYKKTGDGTFYDTSYGKGYSPDYSNSIFIDCHSKAVRALGNHYGGDTFFSYIELGSLGHWGEWHVKYEDGITKLPNAYVREKYIMPYIEAFPNAKILMRRPFKTANEHGFGLYNDMAGHRESTAQWLGWINSGGDFNQTKEHGELVPMESAWKTAPIGGEFTSSIPLNSMLSDNLNDTIDLISSSHTTFLGPKCPKFHEKGADEVLKHMGYRIGISKAVLRKDFAGKKINAELTWVNIGVAPLYWDWPVFLYRLDSGNNIIDKTKVNINLSALLPQESIKTNTEIALGSGKFKLCLGIEDPMTQMPSIILTSDAKRIQKLLLIYEFV